MSCYRRVSAIYDIYIYLNMHLILSVALGYFYNVYVTRKAYYLNCKMMHL